MDLDARIAELDRAPTAALAAEVIEELAGARQWQMAVDRARRAVDAGVERAPVYLGLARGFIRSGKPDRALVILRNLSEAERRQAAAVHVHVQALIESGATEDARQVAERWLIEDPLDDLTIRLLRRVRSERRSPPGTDPMATVGRAEALVLAGHGARAVRMLRQLMFEHPGNENIRNAIREAATHLRKVRRGEIDAAPTPERVDAD